MLDRMTEGIDFHGKALTIRARRQEVLSSNIANADTPGFKARDFDFTAALRAAAGGAAGLSATPAGQWGSAARPASALTAVPATVALALSQPGHLGAGGIRGGQAVEHSTKLQYVTPEQGTLDGNTVDLNRERAAFADNSLRYEASLRFINGGVRTMLTAIRGE